MPSSVTLDRDGLLVAGAESIRRGSLNLGAYATGGVAVTPSQFRLRRIRDLAVRPAGGYVFAWDKQNNKVLAYRENGAATYTQNQPMVEVANAVDLSAVNARFEAKGV